MCVPLVALGGVIGARVRSSCDPGAAFGMARAGGRGVVVAEGLLLAALAFEEAAIAPPVGVRTSLGQVESLVWPRAGRKPCLAQAQALQIRSTKIMMLSRSKRLRGRLIDGGGGRNKEHRWGRPSRHRKSNQDA